MDETRESTVRAIVDYVVPDVRRDPRAALLDVSIKPPLRDDIAKSAAADDLVFRDVRADDRFDIREEKKRKYSLLERNGTGLKVALLEIPDWIAKDGAQVGALDETRYMFQGMAVRVISNGVDVPAKSLRDTMFADWKREKQIDVKFVPWQDISEFRQGVYGLSRLLDLDAVPVVTVTVKLHLTQELLDALAAAFGDRREVEKFLLFKLGVKLNEIVAENVDLKDALFDLWEWAEREGQAQRLVDSLRESKQQNAELMRLIDEGTKAPPDP